MSDYNPGKPGLPLTIWSAVVSIILIRDEQMENDRDKRETERELEREREVLLFSPVFIHLFANAVIGNGLCDWSL